MKKRMLSLFIALILCFSAFSLACPVQAAADSPNVFEDVAWEQDFEPQLVYYDAQRKVSVTGFGHNSGQEFIVALELDGADSVGKKGNFFITDVFVDGYGYDTDWSMRTVSKGDGKYLYFFPEAYLAALGIESFDSVTLKASFDGYYAEETFALDFSVPTTYVDKTTVYPGDAVILDEEQVKVTYIGAAEFFTNEASIEQCILIMVENHVERSCCFDSSEVMNIVNWRLWVYEDLFCVDAGETEIIELRLGRDKLPLWNLFLQARVFYGPEYNDYYFICPFLFFDINGLASTEPPFAAKEQSIFDDGDISVSYVGAARTDNGIVALMHAINGSDTGLRVTGADIGRVNGLKADFQHIAGYDGYDNYSWISAGIDSYFTVRFSSEDALPEDVESLSFSLGIEASKYEDGERKETIISEQKEYSVKVHEILDNTGSPSSHPSWADLRNIDSDITYPDSDSYLNKAYTATVAAANGRSVKAFQKPKPGLFGKSFTLAQDTAVTVIARQGNYSCVLIPSERLAGWVKTVHLIPVP